MRPAGARNLCLDRSVSHGRTETQTHGISGECKSCLHKMFFN